MRCILIDFLIKTQVLLYLQSVEGFKDSVLKSSKKFPLI